ncbi:MAG TPA: aldehyde dehydrogenase family protein [Gemmatimonadaceae bacterium]|nr:aldehyde dehydrogenase family protein [Gemmatimonadaceae bacterium]
MNAAPTSQAPASAAGAPPAGSAAPRPGAPAHPWMHASMDDARRIFDLQRANRWTVAASTARERIAKLRRLKAALLANREALYEAMFADFHKPEAEVELTEIQPTLNELNHTIRRLGHWMHPRRAKTPWLLSGTRSEIRYEPKGVVLVLAPWNYPVLLLLTPLAAAVAAGNCAIVRPSEKVPHTSRVLGDIVRAAFDEHDVALLTGDVPFANAILDLPFDHVFFTGSTKVGRHVMVAAARHLASVTLELGGKSPAIVDETANVKAAAQRIIWGKCINAGQTCVAPDYALVHESRAAEFIEQAKKALDRFYGETPEQRRASPDFCRIVDDAGFARLVGLLDQTVASGARIEAGGDRRAEERYLAPTIVTGLSDHAPLMREEIFGPILPVLTYRTLDEAAELIDRRGKPLALYVFTKRARQVEAVLARTSSGGTVVNNVVIHLANPHLPFGGVGESGTGSYHGVFGFRAFSHERSVLRQGPASMFHRLYPPYVPAVRRLVSLVSRVMG